ncbi:MAG: Flp pilus assembly complex ATPase component TadA [Proteobacteria bacterium]|nr:Flp pilus assembly complex ATPase component TadA [Pseudomonadota bacterium]
MAGPNPKAPDSNSRGHLIAVLGGKGGVGKSVFAANLAVAMAMDAKNQPILVDADPMSTGDLNIILGIKKVVGYGDDVMAGKITDPQKLKAYVTPYPTPVPGAILNTLQLMSNPERMTSSNPDNVELAMNFLRRTFPVTIVDCGNRLEDSILKILDLATVILVVTNPEIIVLNQTRKVLEKLQTNLYPPDMVKIIVNRFPQGSAYTPEFLQQTFKRQVIGLIPEDQSSAMAALVQGKPMVASGQQTGASKSFFAVSRVLLDQGMLGQLANLNKPQRKDLPKAGSNVVSLQDKAEFKTGGAPRGRMGKEPTDPRSIFKLRIHAQLVEKMDLKKDLLNKNMDEVQRAELRSKVMKVVTDVLNQEDHPWKSRNESGQIIKEIIDEAIGLGPLEDLLKDDTVTEVMVNRADLIYIEKGGKNTKSQTTFSSNVQLMSTIERIVTPIGRRIDESTPYVDARLADGSRVHAIIPPLSIDGPMVTIRKFPKKRLGPDDLVKFGSITPEMADFLRSCIEARLNVLVSGGTGSGKTTLLNVLGSFIPSTERILTVEDAAELSLPQEHVGRLETRPANIEGAGAVTIRDLVKQTLRMKPDRIIVGEVRGGEALDMLQAMNTGHDGSMATVHSNNPRDAVARLETLVMMAGMDLPVKAIREQIASAVHLIIQQSRLSDGSRRVTHVTEVIGMQGEVVTLQDIFLYRQTGLDANRKVIGKHAATGFVPKFVEKIEALGIKIPRGLFKAA